MQVWAIERGKLLITAASEIAFIEIFAEEDTECKHFIDYTLGDRSSLPQQITLTENEIRQYLPKDRRNRKVRLEVHSTGQGKQSIDDIGLFLSKASTVKIPGGRTGYRGQKLGFSNMNNTGHIEVILDSSYQQTKFITSIRVYHGFAVDGLEFFYEDRKSQLFGKRGGKPGGSKFAFGENGPVLY